jgi:hypothetical protein
MANTQDVARKKSPRAPTIPLDDAIERVLRIYEKERVHPAPADLVAQAMGYKDANNGRALGALASLRYYGLVDRVGEGKLAVSKDVEAFKYAPNNELRDSYLRKFLATPPLFAELLDRYSTGLPSDGTIRYDLIQRGFLPNSAEVIVAAFRRSVEFAKAFEQEEEFLPEVLASEILDPMSSGATTASSQQQPEGPSTLLNPSTAAIAAPQPTQATHIEDEGHDRIPVRLSGGRRAWLLIPPTLFEADKQRLKAQIDLLLTEDE